MTRLLVFALGFFIGSTMEVQVEAAERVQLTPVNLAYERMHPGSSALLEEPAKCLDSKTATCALRVGEMRRFTLESGSTHEWTLTDKAVVVRLAPDRLRLIEGSIRVRGETSYVETEQGELKIRGEAFVERRDLVLTVVNTGDETLQFKGRGWAEPREIPSGLETHIDLPGVKSGQTSVALPLPLDFDNQVVREARLFTGAKDEFNKRLDHLVELRAAAAVDSARLHQQAVERKIASVAADENAKKKIRDAREAKDRELRALFRRQVLDAE